MKNYHETNNNKHNAHTELVLQPSEFDEFKIGNETNLTFCLTEFRALLSFAEVLKLPLNAAFDDGGE